MTAPFQRFDSINVEGDDAQVAVGVRAGRDVVLQSLTFVRGRPAMSLGKTEITARVDAYVPVGNHELIVKALELDQCAVLAGPPGSGREITAIAAMRELRPDLPLRRFSLEDEDTEEIGARGPHGYLIRAHDGTAKLSQCIDLVRAADSYLAVIADDWAGQVSGLPSFTIDSPPAVDVFRRWITASGYGSWASWDQAARLLEDALPASGRRLARLAEEVEQREAAAPAAEKHIQVLNAYQDWSRDLRAWFRTHQQPHDRALLVSAAALAPASENVIYAAAATLAQQLHIDINGAGLAWCPVTELGTLLDEHQDNSQIVFHRLGFAESTLRHTIADFPLARQDLLSWLADLVTESLAGSRPRTTLASTFADVAADHGEAESIARTARTWASAKNLDPDYTANPAYVALSRTCLHPAVGGRIRRAMYDWSRLAKESVTLKLVIAQVCELLGQTYPSIALTRLKHLATRGNPQVTEQVKQSARSLVESGQYPDVLRAVVAWCALMDTETLSATQRQRRRRVGSDLFLEFAAAIGESGLPDVFRGQEAITPVDCVQAWRATLEFRAEAVAQDSQLVSIVGWWLNAAVLHPRMRAAITSMFVAAASNSYLLPRPAYGSGTSSSPAAQVMSDIARDWFLRGRASPDRREVKEAITVPLTQKEWLKVLKKAWILVRTRFADWHERR